MSWCSCANSLFYWEVISIIRESLYFSFAGRKSSDFGIYNVSISKGLFEEPLTSSKSINELFVRGNNTPYFIETKRDPKQFQLEFSFLETWNEQLIDEVVRWLDVDTYEPLFFSENIDRIFYAMPIDGIKLVHNGLKQGYLTLNIRCSSPFSYSPEITTPWKECLGETLIDIENKGHYSFSPEIWIQKVGDGDITILNHSNNTKEFNFTGLSDNELLYIDCQNELIETNIPNTYRYDDFNDQYLSILYGRNTLRIIGHAKIKFKYRYIYS